MLVLTWIIILHPLYHIKTLKEQWHFKYLTLKLWFFKLKNINFNQINLRNINNSKFNF